MRSSTTLMFVVAVLVIVSIFAMGFFTRGAMGSHSTAVAETAVPALPTACAFWTGLNEALPGHLTANPDQMNPQAAQTMLQNWQIACR